MRIILFAGCLSRGGLNHCKLQNSCGDGIRAGSVVARTMAEHVL